MRLLSRSVSERVPERGWMTENHLNELGMGHPTLSWRVPRFQQKNHELLRTSWKGLWISDVKNQLWNLSGRNSLPSWWRTRESVLQSLFFWFLFLKKNCHFFPSVFGKPSGKVTWQSNMDLDWIDVSPINKMGGPPLWRQVFRRPWSSWTVFVRRAFWFVGLVCDFSQREKCYPTKKGSLEAEEAGNSKKNIVIFVGLLWTLVPLGWSFLMKQALQYMHLILIDLGYIRTLLLYPCISGLKATNTSSTFFHASRVLHRP